MSCENFRELISLYIDGMLDEEEKTNFESHLKACIDCKEEFEEIKSMIDEIHNIPEKALPDDYHKELMLKLYKQKDENKFEKKSSKFNFMKYSTIAASFLLLFVIMASLSNMGSKSSYDNAAQKNELAKEFSGSYDGGEVYNSSFDMPGDFAADSYEKSDAYDGASPEESSASLEQSINVRSTENARSSEIGERKIIYNSFMTLEVELFDDTVKNIREMTENSSGYVENFSSNIYYSEPERDIYLKEGTIIIRIPVEKYGDISRKLEKLGHLISQHETTENVTEQYIETEGKIRMLEVEQDRLLEIMKKADKVEDLIKLEERLTQVRTDLEIYKSKIKNWDQLVAFSTFTINLREVKEIEPIKAPNPNFMTRIKSSFNKSINDVRETFEDFVIALSYNIIPFVIFILILVVGYIIIKPIIKIVFKKVIKKPIVKKIIDIIQKRREQI